MNHGGRHCTMAAMVPHPWLRGTETSANMLYNKAASIPSWCSIWCLFIRVRLWIVVVATLPWLELAWYIWVTNRWYEYGAEFRWTQHCSPWKQELTPSCDLEVYMKQFICIWIPTKRAGLWTHMVYLNCCNHLWVLRLELNNMYENEWKDPDLLASNQDSFWCDSIICYDAEW
jgi:hypothetical protein